MADRQTESKSPRRLRRVRRIKKLIVVGIPVLILIPTVISIILAVRVGVLKRALERSKDELNSYLEIQSEYNFTEALEVSEPVSEEPVTEPVADPSEYRVVSATVPLDKKEVEELTLGNEELYDGYRKVYLTFDDGPSANTSAILDILKEYDVKATFFVIRREGMNNEKLYRRIVSEGHTLGMHSTTHEYSVVYGGEEEFINDTSALRNFLYMVTGVESNYYRFPGGSSNRVSRIDMRVFAKILEDEGIEYYDWNVSAGDAVVPIPDKNTIVANVKAGILRHDESIILFHDAESKKSTVAALPEIIEFIQSLDNTVILPITETTNPIQHLTVSDNK